MIWRTIRFQKKLIEKASHIAVRNICISNPLRKNFYETLGLSNDASPADIKKAYFKLSKLYHPDRIEATDENLAKFREITAAYEILSNEQSRKLYDRGLLGEIRKETREDYSDVVDPIVKFYKQRQELTKELLKPVQEVKTWSPPLRKYGKSSILQKYNFYKKPHELSYMENNPLKYGFLIVSVAIAVSLLGMNFKGSKYWELKENIKHYFN